MNRRSLLKFIPACLLPLLDRKAWAISPGPAAIHHKPSDPIGLENISSFQDAANQFRIWADLSDTTEAWAAFTHSAKVIEYLIAKQTNPDNLPVIKLDPDNPSRISNADEIFANVPWLQHDFKDVECREVLAFLPQQGHRTLYGVVRLSHLRVKAGTELFDMRTTSQTMCSYKAGLNIGHYKHEKTSP